MISLYERCGFRKVEDRRTYHLMLAAEANAYRVAYDVVDAPAVLYTHLTELQAAKEIWPKIEFHAMREHGGLVSHGGRLAA